MKTQLFAAVLFGIGTVTTAQIAAAGDLYYPGQAEPLYQNGDPGTYGGAGELKDPPYTPSYRGRSYKDQSNYSGAGTLKDPPYSPSYRGRSYKDQSDYNSAGSLKDPSYTPSYRGRSYNDQSNYGAGSLKDPSYTPSYRGRSYKGQSNYSGAGSLKDPPYRRSYRGRSYKDQSNYDGKGDRYGYNSGHCLPHWQIRQHLRSYGWFGFHNRKIRHGVVKINAQRADGSIFRLRVDRCTGSILRKRLVFRPQSPYYGGNDGYRRQDYARNHNIY